MGIAFGETKVSMLPQLWCSRYPKDMSPIISKPVDVIPVENWTETDDYITSRTKPLGGLWTSTYTPFNEYCSAWVEWCAEYEQYWLSDICVILYPRSDARIYTIDSYYDLEKLFLQYLWKYVWQEGRSYLDWVKISKDYDAVHATERGYIQGSFMEISPEYPYAKGLQGWDCESTIWFRDVFERVVPLSEDTTRTCLSGEKAIKEYVKLFKKVLKEKRELKT